MTEQTEQTDDKLARHTEGRRLARRGGQNTPNKDVGTDDALGGVTVGWLASVFRMDPKDVKRRLASCNPINPGKMSGRGVQGRKYDLKQAASYLVPPKISPTEFLRSIKKGDLPPSMQQSFWSGKLAEQKWLENAEKLWSTEKVREVLGGTFQALKFTLQLWPDTVRSEVGLTDEQQAILVRLGDALQGDLYESLVAQATDGSTGPQAQEHGEITGAADKAAGYKVSSLEDFEIDELI